LKNTIPSSLALQETLSRVTNTQTQYKMNKLKIIPETVLQEHKPVVLFAPRQYQHLHPAQGSLRASSHVFHF